VTAHEGAVERRLRPLLILIDGHRTALAIQSLTSAIGIREQDFDLLEAGGYIEPIARPRPGAPPPRGAAPALEAPAPAPAPVPPPPRSSLERYADGKRYLSETAADKLGLLSYLFILKVEKCASTADLQALLPEFERALARRLDPGYAFHCRRIAASLLGD
jgi:hypothetical protein